MALFGLFRMGSYFQLPWFGPYHGRDRKLRSSPLSLCLQTS